MLTCIYVISIVHYFIFHIVLSIYLCSYNNVIYDTAQGGCHIHQTPPLYTPLTAAFTITVINKSIFKLTMHAVYNHDFTATCGLHLIVAVVSFRLKSSCVDNIVLKILYNIDILSNKLSNRIFVFLHLRE
jgi:hypothetical protein